MVPRTNNEATSSGDAGSSSEEGSSYVPGYGWVDWDEHRLDVTATIYDRNHQLTAAVGLRRLIRRRRCVCCGQTARGCREGTWARGRKAAAVAAGREMHRA